MSRRSFLRAAAGVGAGIVAGPAVLRADHHEGPLLGHGAHRYRVVEGWGVLDPAEHPVKDCHGMVQDSQGRIILLTNHTANNIIVYDKAGKLIEVWGDRYPGAHGLTLVTENGEDLLWITDHDRHQVYKVTLGGEEVMTLDWPEESGRYESFAMYKPTWVAAAPDGDLFVHDGYGLSYVLQYSAEGELKRVFGGRGDGPEHLVTPHGGAVDVREPQRSALIVASRGQQKLKRFTLEGRYIDTIPMPGAQVCTVQVYEGHLYVPNLNGFISILDENHRVVSNPGGSEPAYDEVGHLRPMEKAMDTFIHPHGILVDDEGDVYVPQWNSNQTYPIKLERVEA